MLKKTALLLGLLLVATVFSGVSVFANDDMELAAGEDYYTRFQGQGLSINVYNWGEYISDGSDDTLNVNAAFEELTGIRVYYSTYATNEELYSKLRSGNASYDVIIPSDYMIGRMIKENMLLPLDKENLPNLEFIGENFVEAAYDPQDAYSAPYTWGYVGVIYNTTMIADEEDLGSWDILWDEKYLGEILMFSNSRDAFAIAQCRQGTSVNSTDDDELRRAMEELKDQKPLVQAYVMDEIFDKMLGGEAILAPYYVGDALTMMADNEDLDFFVPEEGTTRFVDAMCIPKGSRQKEAAEMYINFMLEPEVAAANCEYIGYATPNDAALELLDEEITGDPLAYPPQEFIDKMEYFASLPQETSTVMDQLWVELLSDDEKYNRMLMPALLLVMILASVLIQVYRRRKNTAKSYF